VSQPRSEADLVIAFVDLTLFEKQGQQVSARELADTIDRYYERVAIEVEKEGGTLVKFIGDAALIVFNAADADRAVATLLSLKPTIDGLMKNAGWDCRLTAKAHLGSVVAGPFGARDDKRFDVIGANVNAAARLRSTGVTISRQLYDALSGDARARFRERDSAFVRSDDY
jgi:adenylate cyclase